MKVKTEYKIHKYCVALILVLVLSLVYVALVYPGFLRSRAVGSSFTQTDWSGGSGQTDMADAAKFDSGSNIDYSIADQLKLTQTLEAWAAGGVGATSNTMATKASRSTASGAGIIVSFIDGVSHSVRAQRMVDGNRDLNWPADGVVVYSNPGLSDTQIPKIVGVGGGGAIIIYEASDSNIYAQKVDIFGNPQWGSGVQLETNGIFNHDFDAVSDSSGGAIMVFAITDEVRAQRIISNGTLPWGTDGIQVNSSHGENINAATNGDGTVYFSYNSGGIVFVDRRDGDGNLPSGWLGAVNIGSYSSPKIISGGFEGIVFAGTNGGEIFIQRVLGDGQKPWGASARNITNSSDHLNNGRPHLALLDSGSIGIVWTWGSDPDKNIYLQKVNLSDGLDFSGWPAGGITFGGNGIKDIPLVAQDGGGGVYVFWRENRDSAVQLIGQRVDSDSSIHGGWSGGGTAFRTISQLDNPFFIEYNGALFASLADDTSAPTQRTYVQKVLADLLYSSPGYLTSSIFNAGEQSNFNSLDWAADIPGGSSISVETRSSDGYPGNIALGKTATASSNCGTSCAGSGLPPNLAIDGDSVWPSAWVNNIFGDPGPSGDLPQWIAIDLGTPTTISQVIIKIPVDVGGPGTYAIPKDYKVQTCINNGSCDPSVDSDWADQVNITDNADFERTHAFSSVSTQKVRVYITANSQNLGLPSAVAIAEIEVYSGSSWSCNFGATCVPATLTNADGSSGSIDLSSLAVGQYFQYKITMTSGSTPTLSGVTVNYEPVAISSPTPLPPAYTIPEPTIIPPPDKMSQPLVCVNTLEEVLSTPVPDFPLEWGENYPWGGRDQWAQDHRANIYQLYLDYLGRAPCSIEVNWVMAHDNDINNIRYNILISEEYKRKWGI